MYHDLKQIYWWDDMKKDNADYVAKCPNCQHVKAEHVKPGSRSHIIDITTYKWEAINMDFVVGIPKTLRNHDFIWSTVDKMTMSSNFIPVNSTYRAEDYLKTYIDDIVRWHSIPLSVIFYRGA